METPMPKTLKDVKDALSALCLIAKLTEPYKDLRAGMPKQAGTPKERLWRAELELHRLYVIAYTGLDRNAKKLRADVKRWEKKYKQNAADIARRL